MRRLPGRLLLPVALLSVLAAAASGAELVWLTVDRIPLPVPPSTNSPTFLLSGPLGGVATVAGGVVSLFELDQRGALSATGSTLVDGGVTALALDDVDLDGHLELLSARGDEGALSVDRLLKGQRVPLGPGRYAWEPVTGLRVASTSSGKVLVASTTTGSLVGYTVGARGLEPAGLTEVGRRCELVGTGDLDGDGQDELVTAIGRSEVVVLRWTPGAGGWTRWWRNYPWGGIVAAAAGDLDQDGLPELAVWSGERLLYVFGRNQPGTGLELRWQGSVRLPISGAHLVYLPSPGGSERVAGQARQLLLQAGDSARLLTFGAKFEVSETDLRLGGVRALVPLTETAGGSTLAATRLAVWRQDGTLETVVGLPAERLAVRWLWPDGHSEAAETLVKLGRVYVSARDASDRLGMRVTWNEARKEALVTGADARAVRLVPGSAPLVDGQEVGEAGMVLMHEGRLHLDVRGLELLFGGLRAGVPRLVVTVGDRQVPAVSLW